MIVVDANVLLYAYNRRSEYHEACRAWLERSLQGREQVGLSWTTILAFVRIATNPRVFERPLPISEAVGIVEEWLNCPAVVLVEPSPAYWTTLREQLVAGQATGALVSDAALASLALEHGASLCTKDRDFRRFHGLRLMDPTEKLRLPSYCFSSGFRYDAV